MAGWVKRGEQKYMRQEAYTGRGQSACVCYRTMVILHKYVRLQ